MVSQQIQKLEKNGNLTLTGLARLPKGLISTAFARCQGKNLLIICANLEEAARWATQLEAMTWKGVFFYPTSEACDYVNGKVKPNPMEELAIQSLRSSYI